MGTGRLDCQKAGKGWMLMRRRQKKKHPVRKFLRNMIASLLCIVIVFCELGYYLDQICTDRDLINYVSNISLV